MKYSCISSLIGPYIPFTLHCLEQLLTDISRTEVSILLHVKILPDICIGKEKIMYFDDLPGRVLQTDRLPTHRTLRTSLTPMQKDHQSSI